MNTLINRHLFTASDFDSGSLGVLTSVIHQFNRPGIYQAVIRKSAEKAGTAVFEVSESSMNMQLDIDLAAEVRPQRQQECDCARGVQAIPVVSSRGYVLFFASSGLKGYSVRVGESHEKGQLLFDSQNLGPGDLFALSLLEPTHYVMLNKNGKAKGDIVVSFTSADAKRLKTLETQMIEVSKDKFEPAKVQLTSTQGLVFRVKDSARIVIQRAEKRKPTAAPTQPLRFKTFKPSQKQ